jgi:hypothetical protein
MFNKIDVICAHLKAALIYRPLFGAFGKRSIVMKPILVTHPRHIRIGDRVSIRQGARLEIVLVGEFMAHSHLHGAILWCLAVVVGLVASLLGGIAAYKFVEQPLTDVMKRMSPVS